MKYFQEGKKLALSVVLKYHLNATFNSSSYPNSQLGLDAPPTPWEVEG